MIVNPASDPNFSLSSLHGESAQRELFRSVVRYCVGPRRTCLDVGAHIGLFSIAASEKFDRVVAFEPWPENYDCLLQNVLGRVILPMSRAIGNKLGGPDRMVMGDGDNSGCRYMRDGTGTALDSFNFDDVDLIKIDVEGAEGFVVQGARDTIARCKPVVVFEDNGLGPKHYADWVDPKKVLGEIGYRRMTRLPGKNELWVPK